MALAMLAGAAALGAATIAGAQGPQAGSPPDVTPEVACMAIDAVPPVPFKGWTRRVAVDAAAAATGLPRAALSVGRAANLTLPPAPQVAYPVPPATPGGPASHGGLAALDVARAGTYVVALGSPAWVDLIRDGKPLTPVAHGHGPACMSIRKVVDFDLTPGRYVVQISGAADARVAILIARRP
jgi:hypothetical protein